jgi:hypothetical protein
MVFKCSHCGIEFGRLFNLNRHVKAQHIDTKPTGDNNGPCDGAMTLDHAPNADEKFALELRAHLLNQWNRRLSEHWTAITRNHESSHLARVIT